jgi:hypothetical protein
MNREQFNRNAADLGFSEIADDQMVSLSSSNLSQVSYDFSQRVLIVAFVNGNAYQYSSVPPSAVLSLLGAGSHGSHFHNNIRSSYSFTKL